MRTKTTPKNNAIQFYLAKLLIEENWIRADLITKDITQEEYRKKMEKLIKNTADKIERIEA